MSADLQSPIFNDENAARAALEEVRWPNGPVCPHCGNNEAGTMPVIEGSKRSHRPGLRYCNACKGQFTVTVGTVFERSKVPLTKWWLASHLLGSSKKGMSAHQLHRMLGVTYKTAWFMAHRIREAMTADGNGPIGGKGKTIEADETYFGRRENPKPSPARKGRPYIKRKKPFDKMAVVALVERGGEVRMFKVENATKAEVRDVIVRNADRKSKLYTDESRLYTELGRELASHDTVKHSASEYVRYEADAVIHTNTIENVFSVFKRGMSGVYQHCGESHLHRYLTEFEFRFNRRTGLGWSDKQRVDAIMEGIAGKRLTYRRPDEGAHP